MFGPRLTTVFRSRWRALWWAACILVSVYYWVPKEGDAPDAGASAASSAGQHPHVSPWAKSKPAP